MSSSVQVKNIASNTTEKEVRDFFSFCGKISSLSVTPADNNTQDAVVTFEKDTAAKTALLLDNTQLGTSQVQVTSSQSTGTTQNAPGSPQDNAKSDHVAQEEKPRARIVAEYLAQGYKISDTVIERALTLDKEHGYTAKFQQTLKNLDDRFKATEKAQVVDNKLGVSSKANAGWAGLNSYFEKALGTPTGQKLRAFYEQGEKQVLDVHNEARHLADLNKNQFTPEKTGDGERTKCNCAADDGKCGCAPGECACASCAKNPETDTSKVAEKVAGAAV